MGGKKRTRATCEEEKRAKRIHLNLENPIDLVAGLCRVAHGKALEFLTRYLTHEYVLALCTVNANIKAFVSARISHFKFTKKELNFSEMPDLVARQWGEITSVRYLRELAQKACQNGHAVILRALLEYYDLRPDHKTYNLFHLAQCSYPCMKVLLGWEGQNGERVYIAEKTFQRILYSLVLDSSLLKLLLVRGKEFRLPPITYRATIIRMNEMDLLQIMLEDGRFLFDSFHFRVAVEERNPRAVELLLKHTTFDATNYNVRSSFSMAIKSMSEEIVVLCLRDGRFDPNKVYPVSSQKIAKILLADSRFELRSRLTLLHTACKRGWTELVSIFLKDPRIKMTDWKSEWSVLEEAVSARSTEILSMLLQHTPFTVGLHSAMAKAIELFDLEALRLLVEHKKDIDLCPVLKYACSRPIRAMPLVKFLLAQPNIDPSIGSNAALNFSCRAGDINLVRKLLADSRVDPSNPKHLWAATCYEHWEIAMELTRDIRVDPTGHNNYLMRKLLETGKREFFRKLLQHPKIKDDLGV